MGDPGVFEPRAAQTRRADNLGMLFQEALTVIVRLRSNRQAVGDAQAFRSQVAAALRAAGQDAVSRGYNHEDVRVATFALVAFLDESILNSGNPAFGDWVRRPLQQELFGVDVAGEIYFRNIDHLLARPDSQDLADLLEIYEICLLLGFRGRHSSGSNAELRNVALTLSDKIHRIRGGPTPPFSPAWAPPQEAPRAASDPWVRGLAWGAAGCWVLALLLFGIFKWSLNPASELQSVISFGHF
jgi:type VI secretion system protein ImpK